VALDGIEVDVLLTVTAPDPAPAGTPELVVERWSAVDRPRLHLLAWRSLRVREVWRVHPDEGWIEIVHPTEVQAPQRVSLGDRVISQGTGWRANFDVHAVVADS